MKILTVLGARPQFVKAATVSRALKSHPEATEVIVHTGQHFDALMSDVFFDQLDIPRPNHHLALASLSHGAMTGRMMEALESVIRTERPDCVLVYGDTNSTLAGALAAVKLHVPVAHVEAGLRSRNPKMPEEINRILTDRMSALLFCPTAQAVSNLSLEGYPNPAIGQGGQIEPQQVRQVGDVMYDAVRYYGDRISDEISLAAWGVEEKEYVLCTLHRQENTDDLIRLSRIMRALREIARRHPVIMPLHPRTRQRLACDIERANLGGIRVIDPVPYLEMQCLVMGAKIVMTDSGGLQKEAFFHGVRCVTLRDETEWVETVDAGWNTLVGAETNRILSAVEAEMPRAKYPPPLYGNGKASVFIAQAIRDWCA